MASPLYGFATCGGYPSGLTTNSGGISIWHAFETRRKPFNRLLAASRREILAAMRGCNKPVQAAEFLRRAISLAPANPSAHLNLANACLSAGDRDAAVTAYRACS